MLYTECHMARKHIEPLHTVRPSKQYPIILNVPSFRSEGRMCHFTDKTLYLQYEDAYVNVIIMQSHSIE